MGKTRYNRRKNKVATPTGLPNVKDIEKEDEINEVSNPACPSDAALQNIVDQLQGQVEDKVFALHSLASIFQTPSSVQEIIRQKVARIAGPLLLDPSSSVRNAAAGALRNLTSSGNYEICDLLIEQDIMTPVTAFFLKYSEESYLTSNEAKSEDSDTFVQAVHLLWNLCEGNNTAVQYVNERNLLPMLTKYISASPENLHVTLAVVHCLITVVEENSSACSLLVKSETELNNILTLKGDSCALLLLRVLAAGVLLKIRSDQPGLLTPAVLHAIISPLLQDQRLKLNQLSSIEPGALANDHAALQEIDQLLEAQQISLELLTNLCTDGDDDAMDLDSSSTCSDDGICDVTVSETETNLTDISVSSLTLIPEVHEVIVSQQLMQRIWEKTRVPAENVCGLLHEHSGGEHLLKRVDVLRERAYLCLNNLIPALDIQDFGGQQNLLQMWSEIATTVFKNPEQDPEVLEAASSAMRAALEKLAQNAHDDPVEIQLQHVEFIFSAAQNPDPSVRANILKTVCMLGMIMLSHPSEHNCQIIKNAGKFLLDACGHETELWVLAEALDSVMDLFGEDETDQIAAELGLIDFLKALLPIFRRKVHVNRKKLGGHYALVSTVNTNLPRFIRYKSNRVVSMQTSSV